MTQTGAHTASSQLSRSTERPCLWREAPYRISPRQRSLLPTSSYSRPLVTDESHPPRLLPGPSRRRALHRRPLRISLPHLPQALPAPLGPRVVGPVHHALRRRTHHCALRLSYSDLL